MNSWMISHFREVFSDRSGRVFFCSLSPSRCQGCPQLTLAARLGLAHWKLSQTCFEEGSGDSTGGWESVGIMHEVPRKRGLQTELPSGQGSMKAPCVSQALLLRAEGVGVGFRKKGTRGGGWRAWTGSYLELGKRWGRP